MFDIIWTTVPFISTQWNNITYNIPSVDDLQMEFTALNILELIFLTPSIVLCAYMIYIGHSISLFHRNLCLIFKYGYIWVVLGYLGRFYILLIRMKIIREDSNPTLLFISSFLRLEYYGNIITIQSTYVAERMFATYFVNDYEWNQRTWIVYFLIPFTTFITQVFSLSVLFIETPLIVPLGYCVFMTFWSFFVLNYLYSFNSKKLAYMKLNPLFYTLSKKFQLEENLRVMWYLRGILLLFFCACGVMTILLLVPTFFGLTVVTVKDVIGFIDVAAVLLCTVLPSGMFCTLYYVKHPQFLRKHEWLLGEDVLKKMNRVAPKPIDETNEYFNQLNKSWK